ncbi:hypothetical protein ACIGEP_02955 [Microbacterium sp. NPDC077663]|uniref:hypothetical protein n=1 Tax=Microbacterium sp. NPDC077663 TaxID=3364189 RepID=UPI0037C9A996
MSDLSRHLPLSNRERVDESTVTGDWREALADVVLLAAPLIASPDDATRFLADAGLDATPPLAEVAADIRAGRRRRIRSLVDATRALLALADDRPVDLPATVSGAVALYAVTRMPFDRRAAVSGATLVAQDSGWSLGRGPARPASARDILTFVLGLGDTVPGTSPGREL